MSLEKLSNFSFLTTIQNHLSILDSGCGGNTNRLIEILRDHGAERTEMRVKNEKNIPLIE